MPCYKERNAQYREQYAELMDTVLHADCFSATQKLEYREALREIWNCGTIKIQEEPTTIKLAFRWTDTSQGHRYWYNVYNTLARETGDEQI